MRKPKFKIWWPATAWAILIFIVSSIPNLSAPPLGFTFDDKVAHFAEYLILGVLVVMALHREGISRAHLAALTACAVFGVLDELHQAMVPGRSADILDVLADFLGSAAGTYLFVWIRGNRPRHASRESHNAN